MSGEESAGGHDPEDVEDGGADDGADAEVGLGDEGADHVGEELWRTGAFKEKQEKPGESLYLDKLDGFSSKKTKILLVSETAKRN
jgi:hypothetical protein